MNNNNNKNKNNNNKNNNRGLKECQISFCWQKQQQLLQQNKLIVINLVLIIKLELESYKKMCVQGAKGTKIKEYAIANYGKSLKLTNISAK